MNRSRTSTTTGQFPENGTEFVGRENCKAENESDQSESILYRYLTNPNSTSSVDAAYKSDCMTEHPPKHHTSISSTVPIVILERCDEMRTSKTDDGGKQNHKSDHCISCDMCGKQFEDINQFLSHLKKHVAEETNSSIRAIAYVLLKAMAAKLLSVDEQSDSESPSSSLTKPTEVATEAESVDEDPLPSSEAATPSWSPWTSNSDSKLRPWKSDKLITTTKRQHECGTCQKSFGSSSDLRRHERIHTGEKPYQCHFCSDLFPYNQALQSHIRRTHTGERPFECSLCRKAYVESNGLKGHLKSKEHEDNLLYSFSPAK